MNSDSDACLGSSTPNKNGPVDGGRWPGRRVRKTKKSEHHRARAPLWFDGGAELNPRPVGGACGGLRSHLFRFRWEQTNPGTHPNHLNGGRPGEAVQRCPSSVRVMGRSRSTGNEAVRWMLGTVTANHIVFLILQQYGHMRCHFMSSTIFIHF